MISKNNKYKIIKVKKIEYPEDFIMIEMPNFEEVKKLFSKATIFMTSTHSFILDTLYRNIFFWENGKR
jgi:hypothetical protein